MPSGIRALRKIHFGLRVVNGSWDCCTANSIFSWEIGAYVRARALYA